MVEKISLFLIDCRAIHSWKWVMSSLRSQYKNFSFRLWRKSANPFRSKAEKNLFYYHSPNYFYQSIEYRLLFDFILQVQVKSKIIYIWHQIEVLLVQQIRLNIVQWTMHTTYYMKRMKSAELCAVALRSRSHKKNKLRTENTTLGSEGK